MRIQQLSSTTAMTTILMMISSAALVVHAFTNPSPPTFSKITTATRTTTTSLQMIQHGRSSPRYTRANERSKRQERVGHVIRTELATVLQLGYPIKNPHSYINDELRRRISVVNADVSPDLRQARITVSVIKRSSSSATADDKEDEYSEYDKYDEEEEDEDDDIVYREILPTNNNANSIVDKRQAYSWLVKNTKQIRHSIAQRLKHMKTVPDLTFVQADVGAAVDVMNLIEKVNRGELKRGKVGAFGGDDDELPEYMYLESELEYDDDDDWDEDEDWMDEDEDDGSHSKK